MAKSVNLVKDEELIEETLLAWRNDPVLYFEERLGITNIRQIPHQLEMLRALVLSIMDGKPLVMPSGHAMGKDYIISGGATLWFVECFAPCKVTMTGPTDRQVREIMWAELERAYNNRVIKDSFGRLLVCKLDIESDWFILAFTTKETGQATGKFQGLHSPRKMIVVSEAQAVDDKIYDQIDGITTSGVVLQVYLGNPLRTTGRFAKMIKDTTNNRVMRLDCLESPNVKAGREIISGLVGKPWVEDKEKRWNADGSNRDPRYRARVRGLLPESSIDTVISEELYLKTINKTIIEGLQRGSIGVDPARYGDDDMVISVYLCGRLIDEKRIPFCDAVVGAGEVVIMQKKHFPHGKIAITFDCDGLGGPFLDIVKRMIPDNLEIVYVEFHGSCTDRKIVHQDYHNHRAEAAFWIKEQMENGLVCNDDSEEAQEEACEAHYFISTTSGKIQIEEKEDIKDRLGRSPNTWDSRTLAIWGMKFAPIMTARDQKRRGSGRMLPSNTSYMGA